MFSFLNSFSVRFVIIVILKYLHEFMKFMLVTIALWFYCYCTKIRYYFSYDNFVLFHVGKKIIFSNN